MPGTTRQQVVVSERLAPLTDIERRIESEVHAQLLLAPMVDERGIITHCRDADVLIVGAVEPMTGSTLAQLPRLRCVVRRGVGVDNIDIEAATRLGIAVAIVPDASVEEVSDHALALILSAERRLVAASRATQQGKPGEAGLAVARARRFGDLTLGIVGFGRIGRALARKASPILGRVLVSDPYIEAQDVASLGVSLTTLGELLRSSDVVSLHAPSIPENRHLLNADAFAALRPGTVLVNTARGGLVDEVALLHAIDTGQVAVAALDVTRDEPLAEDSPLLHLDQILLTGHTAAKGRLSSATLRTRATDAAIAALRGHSPQSVSNPEVLLSSDNRLGMS